MFGLGRRLDALARELDARLAALEQRLGARQDAAEAAARAAIDRRFAELVATLSDDPERRTRMLLAAVSDEVRAALAASLDEARRLSALRVDAEDAARQARTHAALNETYRAAATGYVALYFTGGYTDRVRLLVGASDPPDECVCELNCVNDINAYAGGVVRRGEHWRAESEKGEASGVRCVFTPFL